MTPFTEEQLREIIQEIQADPNCSLWEKVMAGKCFALMEEKRAALARAEAAEALEAENARLRGALKPFAVDDPAWTGDGSLQIEMRAVDGVPQPCVTLADVRRARAALKGALEC